jgi:type IV secretory pathway VirB2 component (pilin)
MIYSIATGNAGKAFAAVGIISVGIGFFTGKVSWGLMISVAAGIAVFFGAPQIVALISADSSAEDMCVEAPII